MKKYMLALGVIVLILVLHKPQNAFGYTVSFNMNGHGEQHPDQPIDDGESLGRAPADPSETGWYFEGWLDSDGNPFDFSAPITEDTVINADWSILVSASYTDLEGCYTAEVEAADEIIITVSVDSSYPVEGFEGIFTNYGAGTGLVEDLFDSWTDLTCNYTTPRVPDDYYIVITGVYSCGSYIKAHHSGTHISVKPIAEDTTCTIALAEGSEPVVGQPVTLDLLFIGVNADHILGGTVLLTHLGEGVDNIDFLGELPFSGKSFTFTPEKEGTYSISVNNLLYKLNTIEVECDTYEFTVAPAPAHVISDITVNFAVNKPGYEIPSQTIKNGEKVTKPADPVAEGWIFEGWYSDASLNYLYDFNFVPTENVFLYAKWKQGISYEILDGANATVTANGKDKLIMRSAAPFDKFMYVVLDGTDICFPNNSAYLNTICDRFNIDKTELEKTINNLNYDPTNGFSSRPGEGSSKIESQGGSVSLKMERQEGGISLRNSGNSRISFSEGSTRVTMFPEFLIELGVGMHTIEIVSTDGSAKTKFTINAAPSSDTDEPKPTVTPEPTKPAENPEKPDDTPKTGNGNYAIILGAILLLGAAFAGRAYNKK